MSSWKHRAIAVFATISVLAPSAALAQVSIAGKVTDTTGAVLPGVTVEASSPVLIEKVRTVVTDSQGLYNIVNLVAGPYTVTFSLPGFATIKREGLDLAGTFTATVNAELKVGAVEETITVSGATPVVDVQQVRQNQVFTKELQDALPTGKTFQNYGAIIPGMGIQASVRLSGQDVGGSQSQGTHTLYIHGGNAADMHFTIDGIPQNNANGFNNLGLLIDPGAVQEFNYGTSSNPAEEQLGGVSVNNIPKDGGNRFNGGFFGSYTNGSLDFDNTTDTLRARGVAQANQVQRIWDANPTFGGPLRQDRAWFFASARNWGTNSLPVGAYYNLTPGTLKYTPDLGHPAVDDNWVVSGSLRPTWQITTKNKLTGFYQHMNRCQCHNGLSALTPPEATQYIFQNGTFLQAKFTSTITNRLLFEAGTSRLLYIAANGAQDDAPPQQISTVDQTTGQLYRATTYNRTQHGPVYQWKASMSYVTGSHQFKTGFTLQKNRRDQTQLVNGDLVEQLLNGVPSSVTVYTTPYTAKVRLFPMLGLFVQDQWTTNKLTLTTGVRLDYHNAHNPAQGEPAARFVGPRDFPEITDVPKWFDYAPRFGASYDLFGTGKTALKVAVSRYLNGELFNGVTSAVNPFTTSVNTASRPWRDANGDFVPDESELGPLSNTNFGKVNITTTYDKDYTEGFGKRGYNWEFMAGIQQEVLPRVSVNAAFYRRVYGNFLATDNVSTSPSDYDPYCVTVPVDPRLPGGGGNQLCGFYDVQPVKFGQVNSLVTFAKNYGKQTDIFNGVDLTMDARLRGNSRIGGGLSIGRRATNICEIVNDRPDVSYPGSAAGVLAPRTEAYCNVKPPYQPQIKFQGVYPLPWAGIESSATFQSIAGPPITAVYTARNANITGLDRNLSSGVNGTVRVDLVAPGTLFDDRLYQTDFRLSKAFKFGRTRLKSDFDIYNLFNASPSLAPNNTYGPAWQNVLLVLGGRLIKFGVQLDF
jgi:hypothetical protein